MAKVKAGKLAASIPNKPAHTRVSYLYQAATYLSQQHGAQAALEITKTDVHSTTLPAHIIQSTSRHLLSDLRSVCLKTQVRVSPAVKHSICKNCNTLLIDGSTCTNEVENKSKGQKKPWAAVLLRKCNTCGAQRRFPIASVRQKRRPYRERLS